MCLLSTDKSPITERITRLKTLISLCIKSKLKPNLTGSITQNLTSCASLQGKRFFLWNYKYKIISSHLQDSTTQTSTITAICPTPLLMANQIRMVQTWGWDLWAFSRDDQGNERSYSIASRNGFPLTSVKPAFTLVQGYGIASTDYYIGLILFIIFIKSSVCHVSSCK